MIDVDHTVLSTGLPVVRLAMPGTRAATVLAAFDAGARRRDPGDRALLGPAVERRRHAARPRGLRRPPARSDGARAARSPALVLARRNPRLPRAPLGTRARGRIHRWGSLARRRPTT